MPPPPRKTTRVPAAIAVAGNNNNSNALASSPRPADNPRLRPLRWLVWIYLALWIVEGSLRKWFLPGLSNPLLVVRDPPLLLLYALAMQQRLFPWRHPFVVATLALGVLTALCSLVASQAPWFVVIYGFRANYLHLPLICLLPLLFDEGDVRAVGRWALWLAAPMAVLVLAQFRASSTAWVNTAAGGEGLQMESAYDHVRPAGTFSFTNGMCDFTALLAAFFLFRVLEIKAYARWLWFVAGGALTLLVALSGSRTTVGIVGMVVGGVLLVCYVRPHYWKSSFKLFVLGGAVLIALGSFAVFREGMHVFSYRFGDEESVKTGFFVRYFGTLMPQPETWGITPVAGVGLGMGTNAASALLIGRRYFLTAENEMDRVLLESGPILGVAFIVLRYILLGWLFVQVWQAVRQRGQPLPLLILCAGASSILIGQYAQPTELGYAVIIAGLCLAACRPAPGAAASGVDDAAAAAEALPTSGQQAAVVAPTAGQKREGKKAAPAVAATVARATATSPPALTRGRSAYAERLHASRRQPAENSSTETPPAPHEGSA